MPLGCLQGGVAPRASAQAAQALPSSLLLFTPPPSSPAQLPRAGRRRCRRGERGMHDCGRGRKRVREGARPEAISRSVCPGKAILWTCRCIQTRVYEQVQKLRQRNFSARADHWCRPSPLIGKEGRGAGIDHAPREAEAAKDEILNPRPATMTFGTLNPEP